MMDLENRIFGAIVITLLFALLAVPLTYFFDLLWWWLLVPLVVPGLAWLVAPHPKEEAGQNE